MTAGLPSYRPSRRVYASRSARVLSNEVVTSSDSKGWALWVTKLYCKLISLNDYLRRGNERSYILNVSFVSDTGMYESCWIIGIASLSQLSWISWIAALS